ncbi:hypothetical protein DFH07DRAFT_132477 [Mycena maculata]|uniref:Uncharacterized protein n=1 Tax=Mycena maculata TaxID=230809 RepID=A0AAD7MVA4_9AGAR|nr:hypothetical protein DFH07DRAFT_132477 [Mycena maculata]
MSDAHRSLPSSPVQNEEDLAGAHQWSDDDEAEHLDPSNKAKGKSRQLSPNPEEDDDPQEYPPVNDDEAETRRIQENLKRWEVAERMKRKAARESTHEIQPSLLTNVTRRASLLWQGRRNSQHPHNIDSSLGAHTALNTQDSADVVPLDDIAATPTPSPTHSEPSDPFANPQTLDPFSDAEAVMNPSADPPTPTPMISPTRPALLTVSSSFRRPPTPKPMDLPPPRAPPPQNTLPPIPVPDDDEHEPKMRWWHEWLCGFGEGDDRGGEEQAGRTNPNE